MHPISKKKKKKKKALEAPNQRPPFCHLTIHSLPISPSSLSYSFPISLCLPAIFAGKTLRPNLQLTSIHDPAHFSLSPPHSPPLSFSFVLSLSHGLPEISSVDGLRADTRRSNRSKVSQNAGRWFPHNKIVAVKGGTQAVATIVLPPPATFDYGGSISFFSIPQS